MEGAFEQPAARAIRVNAARPYYRATRLCRLGDRARGDRRCDWDRRRRSAGAPADVPETRLEIVTASGRRSAVLRDLSRRPQRGLPGGTGPAPALASSRSIRTEPRPLAGTDGGANPFWSPGSESVAFNARGVLKRIDLASGLVRTLASRPVRRGNMERRWNDPHRQRHRPTPQYFSRWRRPQGSHQAAARTEQSPLAAISTGWPTIPALHLGTA